MNKKPVKKKSTKGKVISAFRGSPTKTYLAQLKRIEDFQKSVGMDKYRNMVV